jgi:hypothetical protein
MAPTWQEGDDPLFGVLLSSFHGKLVQHLHLKGGGNTKNENLSQYNEYIERK